MIKLLVERQIAILLTLTIASYEAVREGISADAEKMREIATVFFFRAFYKSRRHKFPSSVPSNERHKFLE